MSRKAFRKSPIWRAVQGLYQIKLGCVMGFVTISVCTLNSDGAGNHLDASPDLHPGIAVYPIRHLGGRRCAQNMESVRKLLEADIIEESD